MNLYVHQQNKNKIINKTGLVMFAKAQHGVGKAVIKRMHVL